MEEIEKAFCELFDQAEKIKHWHDSEDGITVSKHEVFELWNILEIHRELREELIIKRD